MRKLFLLELTLIASVAFGTDYFIANHEPTIHSVATKAGNEVAIFPESIYTNLVMYLPFETDEGTNYYDYSTEKTSCNSTGAPSFNASRYVEFHGTNQVNVGTWGTYTNLSEMTVNVRCKFNMFTNNPTIWSTIPEGTSEGLFTWILALADQKFYIRLRPADAQAPQLYAKSTLALIPSNTWCNITTVLGDQGNAFYIDGTALEMTYTDGNAATTYCIDDIEATQLFVLGLLKHQGDFRYHLNDGALDDLTIFNRALTATEISNRWYTAP